MYQPIAIQYYDTQTHMTNGLKQHLDGDRDLNREVTHPQTPDDQSIESFRSQLEEQFRVGPSQFERKKTQDRVSGALTGVLQHTMLVNRLMFDRNDVWQELLTILPTIAIKIKEMGEGSALIFHRFPEVRNVLGATDHKTLRHALNAITVYERSRLLHYLHELFRTDAKKEDTVSHLLPILQILSSALISLKESGDAKSSRSIADMIGDPTKSHTSLAIALPDSESYIIYERLPHAGFRSILVQAGNVVEVRENSAISPEVTGPQVKSAERYRHFIADQELLLRVQYRGAINKHPRLEYLLHDQKSFDRRTPKITEVEGLPVEEYYEGKLRELDEPLKKSTQSLCKKLIVEPEAASYLGMPEFSEAYIDPLTGVMNREGFKLVAEKAKLGAAPLLCAAFDGDNFKGLNFLKGEKYGDYIVRLIGLELNTLAARLMDQGASFCVPMRMGGEEFCVFAQGVSPEVFRTEMEQFSKRVKLHIQGSMNESEQQLYRDLVLFTKDEAVSPNAIGGSTVSLGMLNPVDDIGTPLTIGKHFVEKTYQIVDADVTKAKASKSKKSGKDKVGEFRSIDYDEVINYFPNFPTGQVHKRNLKQAHEQKGQDLKHSHREYLDNLIDTLRIGMMSAGSDIETWTPREHEEIQYALTSMAYAHTPECMSQYPELFAEARKHYLCYLASNSVHMGSLTEAGVEREERLLQAQSAPYVKLQVNAKLFKAYNEILGHVGGDHVIRLVVDALRASHFPQATRVHIANKADVFTVLFEGTNDERVFSGLADYLEGYISTHLFDTINARAGRTHDIRHAFEAYLDEHGQSDMKNELGTFRVIPLEKLKKDAKI